MRFLMSHAGNAHARRVLVTPQSGNITAVRNGAMWAVDNNAFTKGFKPVVFFPWLAALRPYAHNCLFVVVPDVVGDPIQTAANYRHWLTYFEGWRVAFAAQDGQEHLPLPNYFDALFVGGSTEWKEGAGAVQCIKRAQQRGAHVHIGRVNWQRRYNLFRVLQGSDRFTCDGTRQRYAGVEKTEQAWERYEAQRQLLSV